LRPLLGAHLRRGRPSAGGGGMGEGGHAGDFFRLRLTSDHRLFRTRGMSTPQPAPSGAGRALFRGRFVAALAVLAVLSLAGLAAAGMFYLRYVEVWARRPPPPPRCIMATRMGLRRLMQVSGTEPHDDARGQTAYLRPNEDRAVRCVSGFSKDLARHFATAFAELEPEPRALMLLKAVRDGVPQDPSYDREAIAGFLLASAALKALPPLPETKAAEEELVLLNACRFQMRTPCPSRPPIPATVWLAGVPSTGGILVVLGFGIRSAYVRIHDVLRRRRARKASSKK
jgi:hypothetical protein